MSDKCVYIKDATNGYVIVCLYIDDMLIIGSNNDIIKATKRMLINEFNIKDLVTRIKMHIFKVKLPFYHPCEVKHGLQNRMSTQGQ